jgi:histone-lysine N-methyltransferase SETMAR
VTAITGKSGIEGMIIDNDNCEVHNSAGTTQTLDEFQVIGLADPPYSPDISPSDFWFFRWSKDMMKGHQFQNADDVRAFFIDLWSNLDQSTLISVDEGWIARLDEVIPTKGERYATSGI